ncbi:MAG: hypothetical protein E7Y34_00940 [Mycoplasma sp.]|nr:hypothetical protein [Mycoplasma sp.]
MVSWFLNIDYSELIFEAERCLKPIEMILLLKLKFICTHVHLSDLFLQLLVLKYVQNKDIFMRYYKSHLTRRLILESSADSEKDKIMVEWLRVSKVLNFYLDMSFIIYKILLIINLYLFIYLSPHTKGCWYACWLCKQISKDVSRCKH